MDAVPPRLAPDPTLRLRVLFGDLAMLGPGKAALLEQIAATGSIAAAGRRMGMSYKRAWMLVDEMNAAFARPLVNSARGGPGGGGATLTAAGTEVLARFRAIEQAAAAATADHLRALQAMLAPARPGPATAATAGGPAGLATPPPSAGDLPVAGDDAAEAPAAPGDRNDRE